MSGLSDIVRKLAIANFNAWISDKPIGFQFTTHDVIDRFKHTAPKMTPMRGSIGHIVQQNPRVCIVGKYHGVTLYEVVA